MLDASNNYALTTLATFDTANGRSPTGELLADAAGNLYGATYEGGDFGYGPGVFGYGTIFQLTNTGFVVPEPSSAAAVLLALSATGLRRRKRR